ncbi:MAG TPA: acyl carrier protein [Anaerolineales bacterium]|nr:acyl carrier protein [Anaerolineales bacterium]
MEANRTLTDQVCALLTEALRVEPGDIGPETQFGDLPQWDSMGHMEVMVALEKEYGVEITAESITELVSVPVIVAHIEDK